jgi:hypothetical protein
VKRRTLLATVGVTLAVGAAGCVSDGDGDPTGGAGGDDPTTDPRTDSTTDAPPGTTTPEENRTPDGGGETPGPDTVFDPAAAEPFREVAIGSRDGVAFPDQHLPHGLAVWNAAGTDRDLTLTLRAGSATLFDETVTFPADGYLALTLNEPASYDLVVTSEGEGLGTVAVGESNFDCNGSSTNVGVMPDGELRSTTVSTTQACAFPKLSGTTIDSGTGTCGEADDATVSFADGRVVVDGSLRSPDPCHRATLAAVSYDDDALIVTVAPRSTGSTTTACQQCVATVPYTARAAFDVSYPNTVRVVHRSADGSSRTVATVDRED